MSRVTGQQSNLAAEISQGNRAAFGDVRGCSRKVTGAVSSYWNRQCSGTYCGRLVALACGPVMHPDSRFRCARPLPVCPAHVVISSHGASVHRFRPPSSHLTLPPHLLPPPAL